MGIVNTVQKESEYLKNKRKSLKVIEFLSYDDPQPKENQIVLCKIPSMRSVFGNKSKKFLEELFVY